MRIHGLLKIVACRGHASRVASLSWGSPSLLSSGSRDSMIHNHDVRADPHCVAALQGHQQEVCGLKWSLQGTQLASGGNDNLLHVWEPRQNRPRLCIERHSAAVKALAWCPFQHNVLASGGGTADRKICLWNTGNGACLNEVDTKSQVTRCMRKQPMELQHSCACLYVQLIDLYVQLIDLYVQYV